MATNRNFFELLAAAKETNQSNLCIGIDPVPTLFPGLWRNDSSKIFDFCCGVRDATYDLVIAYKPQIACFAENRAEGQLERFIASTVSLDLCPVILDAKRGDIGKTAKRYAREAFERYQADAVTLSPYAGWESLEPYTHHPGKCLIPLCRTSNEGSDDMQVRAVRMLTDEQMREVERHIGRERPIHGRYLPLYLWIAYQAATQWSQYGQFGLVTGATHPEELRLVREMAPKLPLLVPGFGDQGGTAEDAMLVDRPDAPAIVVSASKIIHPLGVDLASYVGREEAYFIEVVRPAAIQALDELRAARPNLATA